MPAFSIGTSSRSILILGNNFYGIKPWPKASRMKTANFKNLSDWKFSSYRIRTIRRNNANKQIQCSTSIDDKFNTIFVI